MSLLSSIIGVLICITMNASTPNPMLALQQPQKFMASLTASDEVPAKNTTAKGIFKIDIAPGRVSNYTLNVSNISNVTLVHIHQGENGTNGPIVATIYKSANGSNQMKGNFLLNGKLFGKQFEGPLAGKYIHDLLSLIGEGQIYVNVHTKQNPQGEIRGQLLNITLHR